MLDVRSASLGLREQLFAHTSVLSSGRTDLQTKAHKESSELAPQEPEPVPSERVTAVDSSPPVVQVLSSSAESNVSSFLAALPTFHSPSGRLQISLQEMISTSIALKSGLDIEVIDTPAEPGWTAALVDRQLRTRSRSPSRKSVASLSVRSPSPEVTRELEPKEGVPSHVAVAIAGLQREILMLRSELNFELWMARENVKHIGRLYQDRVVSRNAEMERQGLVNTVS